MPTHNIAISLVLPAYNEALRLPPYLAQIQHYLADRYPHTHEVIVVDDGSTDGLLAEVERLAADWPQLRWLRHPTNLGKGAAVRSGVLASQGDLVLFADADGATAIEEENRLAAAIHSGADLAVGSRLVPGAGGQCSRVASRALAGRLFAAIARWCFSLPIHDPQCGFKMFRGDAARRLFSSLHEPRYLFDLELLARAQKLGYTTAEVAIGWREVPGGHLSLAREFPRILFDFWRLRQRLRTEPVLPK